MSRISYEQYLAAKNNIRAFKEHIAMNTDTIMLLLDKIEQERQQITSFKEAIEHNENIILAYEKVEEIDFKNRSKGK